jgi:hypothetical protein
VEDNIVYLSEKTATSQEGKQQGKERTITGVVSDDMGPLIGVNVLVKGTSNGCITDLDGNFTLTTTEANPVLVFSPLTVTDCPFAAAGVFSFTVHLPSAAALVVTVLSVHDAFTETRSPGVAFPHRLTCAFCCNTILSEKIAGSTTLAETEPANTKRKEINPSSFFMCL